MTEAQNPQVPSITPQQVAEAAGAGVTFLNLDTTLIPGNLRRQLAVLEVVLQNVANGRAQVVTPQPLPVESNDGEGDDGPDDISDLTEGGDDA